MESDKQQDWIDRFLRDELTTEEKSIFEKKMQEDETFAQEVHVLKSISEGIKHSGNDSLRKRLTEISDEVKTSSKNSGQGGKVIRIILSIAAIIALIVFANNIFGTAENYNQKLFTEFYEPYNTSFTTRSTQKELLMAQAEEAYRQKKYETVVPLLKELVTVEPDNFPIQLSLGNALLQLDNHSEAQKVFQNIVGTKNELFVDQANWYLALSYLKEDRIEMSKRILKILSEKEGADFQGEAKELLEELISDK